MPNTPIFVKVSSRSLPLISTRFISKLESNCLSTLHTLWHYFILSHISWSLKTQSTCYAFTKFILKVIFYTTPQVIVPVLGGMKELLHTQPVNKSVIFHQTWQKSKIIIHKSLCLCVSFSLCKCHAFWQLKKTKRSKGLNGHLSIETALTSCQKGSYLHINSCIIE